jgi:hypothetical protein
MVINFGLTNFCLKELYDIIFLIKVQGVRQEVSRDLHVGYWKGRVQFTWCNHDSLKSTQELNCCC